MLNVCSAFSPEKKTEFEKISLSRRTVVRLIEMMANYVKTTLTDRMAGFESFFIALDKSTNLFDTAQLAIFIRGYLDDLNLKLQKQEQLVNDLYNHLKVFQHKIRLWEAQTLSGNSYHSTALSAYENVAYAQYAEELQLLSEKFSNRFSYFKNMTVYERDCCAVSLRGSKSELHRFQGKIVSMQRDGS
ncbi:hypothetical protein EVAR_32180_1 [Eumeta japonica]|uniref:General transcription factor II-I repeat domain-containing protein 2 n=1 Tax=Eumeta variegata TaxID=151549 RepID=A0A4C1W0D5_EUMVA|nr:hypothetical protein EVAR_32180_1 [Eumeta japonica]